MLPGSRYEENLLNHAKDLWKLPYLEKVFQEEWKILKKSRHPLAQKATSSAMVSTLNKCCRRIK